jgi:long-chain acyl-CoA synthetase
MQTTNRKSYVYDVRDVADFRQLVTSSAELFGDRCAFLLREDGILRDVSYNEFFHDVQCFTAALRSEIKEDARVGVMGRNCYAWALSYLSVACGVGVVVPIDKELKGEELSSVAKKADLEAIICDDKLADMCAACGVKAIPFSSVSEMIIRGDSLREAGDRSFETHKIHRDELGILLFTSGTEGVAKGVMLSQYNICSDIVRVLRKINVTPNDRVMSLLPLHHTYECTAGFLSVLYSGASITYCEGLRTLQRDLSDYAPTVFVAVPLLLENFRKNILRNYKKIPGGSALLKAQRRLVKLGRSPRAVFSQIHEFFGGRLRLMLCGAAPLAPEVFRDFEDFGIRVYCGYGLTETSPIAIMHSDFYSSPDDTGSPIPGMSVKLDIENPDDKSGELLLRGDTVMLGYLDNPDANKAAFTEDGWLRTGDIAEVDEHGHYRIVGRCKSMIVTKNGKKIFPEEVEHYLSESPYISECMVYGDEREHDTVVTAVIRPDMDAVNARLKKDGVEADSVEYEEALKELMVSEAKEASSHLPPFKAIRAVKVRRSEFSKTTTHKIRRGDKTNYDE